LGYFMDWASNEMSTTAMCELCLDWAQIHQNLHGLWRDTLLLSALCPGSYWFLFSGSVLGIERRGSLLSGD